MKATYRRTFRTAGEIVRTEHKCEILKVNKNSYTIKILNWFEDKNPVKTVQKKSVTIN